uniref:Uncharacterized protein n=1 Tax=Chlamydomonas euryale TaxID=1486919 RepID=A0A7R9VWS3_9CHLO|mmetsp:Transcript_633/g.1717  ORF Transcript_633/g.1717 Transcript_633/m.1717 type:complete len:235 (+) Transcript_633:3-707(+)
MDGSFKAATSVQALVKEGGKKRRVKGEPAQPKKPRANTAYTLFITRAIDKIQNDASYGKLLEREDGKNVHPLTVAAQMWKALGSDQREFFSKVYTPLIEGMKNEWEETGNKPSDKLLERMNEFDKKLDKPTRTKVAAMMLPAVKVAEFMASVGAAVSAAAAAAAAQSHKQNDDSSDDSSDDSDDSDEEDAAKKAAAAAAAAKEAERKAKESAEKKDKKHKSKHEHKAKKHKHNE